MSIGLLAIIFILIIAVGATILTIEIITTLVELDNKKLLEK